MLEKPPITDNHIISAIREHYDLTISDLEFLPLGLDNHASVYRLQAVDGLRYFLKLKADDIDTRILALPRFLNDEGLSQVVASIPTTNGQLWSTLDTYTMLLYPFIEGINGWGQNLADHQWQAYGKFLKSMHSIEPSPDLRAQLRTEKFSPNPHWHSMTTRLHEAVLQQSYANPIAEALAVFWRDHHDEISLVLERMEILGQRCRQKSTPFVICHSDIHMGNLLIAPNETLYVVDWDQPLLAPKECDLLFVTKGGFLTDQRVIDLVFEGYGEAEIDWEILTYYRYARAVEDLGGYAEPIYFMDGVSDATKQESADGFRAQFDPDNMIHAAHELWDMV